MKKLNLTNNFVVTVLALLCCLLWGSAFPCIKIGYELFEIGANDTFSQILFAGVRFTVAGALVILFSSVSAKKFLVPTERRTISRCFILSLIQTVAQYIFFYVGLAHTSGVNASVIEAVNVFFAIIISAMFFKQEKLTAKSIVGCLIGFIGVVIVNISSGENAFSFNFLGDGMIVLSALSYALSSVLIKEYSKKDNPVILAGWQFFIGGIIMCIFGFALGGRIEKISGNGAAMLVYLALVSAVAYTVWGILLKHNDVSKVTVIGFMNPVFGVLLSALALGETAQAFNLKNLLALVLVCVGIFVVNKKVEN